MDGTTETMFSPNEAITQESFARTVALAENATTSQTSNANTNNTASVAWVANQNIMSISNPNGTVTRAEAAEILSRLVEYHEQQTTTSSMEMSTSTLVSTAICERKIDETLSLSGLMDEETGSVINASEPLTRAEAAQMISGYLVYRDKPTLITGTTPLTYLGSFEAIDTETLNTALMDDDESFHIELAGFNPEDGTVSPEWTSKGEIDESVHKKLASRSIYILFFDKGDSVSYIREKYSETARNHIYIGTRDPDVYEKDNSSAGHYCSPDLKNKFGETSLTAYTCFNDHYYNAKVNYSWGSYTTAYNKLGRAIHYLQDINSPPHAALITNDDNKRHEKFEVWVRDNFHDYTNQFFESTAANSYSFMCNSTFAEISQNFATLSARVADACCPNNIDDISIPDTAECLKCTQRAVAGLAYRYLIDTGRAN